jgi:predicted GNAT family acetyltransferase
MIALANVTQPGPFGPRTIELGHYIGVRRQGALVAMAGERLRLDGFTEISAVCVEPAHRGHGFAAELVRSLASSIAARSEIPFLHVFSSNHAAIALYRKLGFTLRRRMHLAVLIRAATG